MILNFLLGIAIFALALCAFVRFVKGVIRRMDDQRIVDKQIFVNRVLNDFKVADSLVIETSDLSSRRFTYNRVSIGESKIVIDKFYGTKSYYIYSDGGICIDFAKAAMQALSDNGYHGEMGLFAPRPRIPDPSPAWHPTWPRPGGYSARIKGPP